jgi:hypothetical protein
MYLEDVTEGSNSSDPAEAAYNVEECTRIVSIVRMTFVLAVFHLIVMGFICPKSTFASQFEGGCWSFKNLFIFGSFIASMWIPMASFFYGYLYFTRLFSLFFLIF